MKYLEPDFSELDSDKVRRVLAEAKKILLDGPYAFVCDAIGNVDDDSLHETCCGMVLAIGLALNDRHRTTYALRDWVKKETGTDIGPRSSSSETAVEYRLRWIEHMQKVYE